MDNGPVWVIKEPFRYGCAIGQADGEGAGFCRCAYFMQIAVKLQLNYNKKMKHIVKLWTLMAVVVSCVACKAQPKAPKLAVNKDENTLFWEVSGKGLKEPSYIYGTFHMMCPEDIVFSDAVKKALKYTKELYLELPLDDAAGMLKALDKMMMKDGKQLKDFYTTEEYDRVKKFFKDSLNTSIGMMERMIPALAGALVYPKLLGCNISGGTETGLSKIVKEQKKPVKGLETFEFQLSIFNSIPYTEQAKELLKNVDNFTKSKQQADSLVKAYKSQMITEMEKGFSNAEFGMAENLEIMLYKRNENWAVQLPPLMKEHSLFIAVGTGHLVGKRGLINLLREAGYTVKPLVNDVYR